MASPGTGIPPLQLSSGPAVSGGAPFYGGRAATGDFTYQGRQTPGEMLAQAVPFVVLVGAAWLILRG
jgi:hypothetical protein